MKKRVKTIAAGALAAGLVAMPGCTSEPPEAIYGPPSAFSASESASSESAETAVSSGSSEVADPAEFDPAENIPEDIYGPPEAFNQGDGEDFNPEANVLEGIYGPPRSVVGTLVGAMGDAIAAVQEKFDERNNVPETVYGPPEMLGWGDEDSDEN